jgi:hydroxypyruvate reductase
MKPDVLLVEPMMAPIEASMDISYCVHRLFEAPDWTALVAKIAPKVRGIVTGGATGASNDLVDRLPALEIIAINGIGTDAVDLERARKRKIRVTTTPDVVTDDVADLGIGLLLDAARQVSTADRFVRAGRWARREGLPLARKVSGKKLGILGMGRIGRAVAQRAQGFNLAISYTDIQAFGDLPYRYEPDLEVLARDSDFLIVAAAGGPQSRGIVGASAGAKVPPHWHPAIEHVTVISGVFNAGLSDKLDESKTTPLPVGSIAITQPKTTHFGIFNEETILQVHGTGPWEINYINPANDPRKKTD